MLSCCVLPCLGACLVLWCFSSSLFVLLYVLCYGLKIENKTRQALLYRLTSPWRSHCTKKKQRQTKRQRYRQDKPYSHPSIHFFHLFCCHLVFAMAPVALIRTAAQRAASASRWEEALSRLVLCRVLAWLGLSSLVGLALPYFALSLVLFWSSLGLVSWSCLLCLVFGSSCLVLSCFVLWCLLVCLVVVLSCHVIVLSRLVALCCEFFPPSNGANPFHLATQPSSQSRTLVSRSVPRMGGDHGHVIK
jgi:hypothetical protein